MWTVARLDPTECRAVNEARLTVTGDARATAFGQDGWAASHVRVFANEGQQRAAFAREARADAVRCLGVAIAGDGFVVEEVQTVPLPPLASETRVFRIVFSRASGRLTFVDVAFMRRHRALAQVSFGFNDPLDVER